MRGRLLLGAASAAFIAFGAVATAQEIDPADDASTRARFTIDQTVEGAIDPLGDGDWYRVRLEQGQRYTFRLDGVVDAQGLALDPLLTIYDTDGNQLAVNDDANGTLNSELSFTPSTSGDVLLEASAFVDGGVGRYTLAASASAAPADDAGNDRTTRGRVAPGAAVSGAIEYEGDVDWYRMRANPNQRYRVSLDSDTNAAAPLADPFLRVLDSDGNEIAFNDDTEAGLNAMVEFVPQRTGDVFIEANGLGGAITGAYTINVTAERVPNDNTSGATDTRGRIATGQTINATLDYAGDRDWYRIRLEQGQSYRFTLAGAGEAPIEDTMLHLYGADGEPIAVDDDGGEGFDAYLEFTAPTTGAYFVEARGFAEEATGGYSLAALAGDIPADTSTDATLSADGDFREGLLSPSGDRDWFRLNLAEGQAFRLGLNSAEGAGDALADPYLALYGPDGAELVRDDDGGEDLNAWLEYQATAAGSYYVEVRGFIEDSQGRYHLTLTPGEIGASADAAEYIMPNNEGRSSVIGADGDVDWFVIETIEGRPYRFNLEAVDPDPLTDPMLTLYNAEGVEITSDDDGGAGLNAYINHASTTGGPVFAAASSFRSTGSGRYLLRVTDTDVPGHIYTDEMLNPLDDARLSRIDMPGDLDYYRVELEGGVRYLIGVSGEGDDALADPFLTIVDQENNRITSDDDSGDGLDARLRFTPEAAGAYYIQASGLARSTGGYRVSIVRQ